MSSVQGGTREALFEYLGVTEDLRGIGEQLYWDMTTNLPPQSVRARGRQSAFVDREVLNRSSSDELERLIGGMRSFSLDDDTTLVLQTAERDLRAARALPASLMAEFSSSGAEAVEVWREARKANDWSSFSPWLTKLVDLNRRIAEHVGYADHPLDALLSMYEPGPTKSRVDALVDPLREPLRQAARVRRASGGEAAPLSHVVAAPAAVLELVREIGAVLGFDYERGMVAESAHPATSSAGPEDVRITVRTDVPFPQVISAAVHEFGHALYDQGIDSRFWRTPVGRGSMPYVHESQSKFFENHLLRHPGFSEMVAPMVRRHLGIDISAEELRRALVDRGISMIRINSDEIGFMLHIIIRWDIECALLDDSLRAEDVPSAWNERAEFYLGRAPADDREGCLQDPHWCHRFMGLFPGYLIGSVAAAQMWKASAAAGVDVAACLSERDLSPLVAWLRGTVHGAGRAYSIDQILAGMGQGGLNAGPYAELVLGAHRDD